MRTYDKYMTSDNSQSNREWSRTVEVFPVRIARRKDDEDQNKSNDELNSECLFRRQLSRDRRGPSEPWTSVGVRPLRMVAARIALTHCTTTNTAARARLISRVPAVATVTAWLM